MASGRRRRVTPVACLVFVASVVWRVKASTAGWRMLGFAESCDAHTTKSELPQARYQGTSRKTRAGLIAVATVCSGSLLYFDFFFS